MSVACQVNWASNFVVGIGWPYMHQLMGAYSFVTFGCLLLATFLFTWQYLPETAGRTVGEVQRAANEPKRRWGGMFGGGDRDASAGRAGSLNDGVNNDHEDQNHAGGGNAMQYVVVEGVDLSMS